MDINSLLSPSEAAADEHTTEGSSPHHSPTKGAVAMRPSFAQRKSSGLSQQMTPDDITSAPSPSAGAQYFPRVSQISQSPSSRPLLSPHAHAIPMSQQQPTSYAAQHPDVARTSQSSYGRQSPGLTTGPASATSTPEVQTPLSQQPLSSRQVSNPPMDTPADHTAMQHSYASPRKPAARNSPALSAADIRAAQLATSTSAYSPGLNRPIASRHPTENTLTGVQTPPHTFNTQSLSPEDVDALNETAVTLHSSALNYQAHVRMVKLLHKGLLNYIGGVDGKERVGRDYDLLAELRKAREGMDTIYPLGEDLWSEWISDEKRLAGTTEDRIAVMNLCSKAVTDEPSSAKLWRQYGDYMYDLYSAANGIVDNVGWSEEDRIIGQEVFTWPSVNNVWEQGVLATQWRMNDSNSVWDQYMEILQAERKRKGREAPFSIAQLQQLFVERLTQPHATWENTFQNFSMFISETAPQELYEQTMAKATARAGQAKQMWSLREMYELRVSQAGSAEDKDAEWEAYSEYLTWEVTKKGIFSGHLIVALYERAVTRFSAEATLWEDYVEYLLLDKPANVDILTVLARATRHCPWSGSLWSHRLVALEAAGKNFVEMEAVKHKATRTGILELAGVEELLKVYIAWCGFLRRRAFENERTDEDDLDIAEVGIRSALEHVLEVGEQLYGKERWPGDPQYRLERIHIKFWTQAGNAEAARKIWRGIAPFQRDNYDFWYRWYIWEMVVWSNFAIRTNDAKDNGLRNPVESTAILKQALEHVGTLDYPEQLVQMFLSHCEQHESVTELQNAFVITKKLNKQIYERRQQEHQLQAAQQRAQYEQESLMEVVEDTTAPIAISTKDSARADSGAEEAGSTGKRKADDMAEGPSKKQRTSDNPETTVTGQPKRDREHTTILAKGLPSGVTQTAVRKFFRDSGTIVSIKLNDEPDSTVSATVEFESAEDAQFALTRSTRPFDGQEIDISYACGSTLWVSNYPPEADQKYIRSLFEKFGEVIDVRFPSLKYNTHRRFCYVQLATPAEALAATALDGTTVESEDPNVGSKNSYKLIAKISAPEKKTDREGAQQEGREVYVGQLSWFASDAELREVFGECGLVERVRIPKNVAGKSKGAAFVTYSTPGEAQDAIAQLQGREIRGRAISLEIAKSNAGGPKRTATSTTTGRGRSGTPATNGDISMNGDAASPAASHVSDAAAATVSSAATGDNRKERTLYLVNIPDTVNDTRVRAFLERFGTLKKLILRPDHQGAIAEFATVADAGKAEMKLPDARFDFDEGTGRYVEAVEEKQFFKTQQEWRSDRLGKAPKPIAATNGSSGNGGAGGAAKTLAAPRISRPGQAGGRRGGLGVKRGVAALGGPQATNHGRDDAVGEKGQGGEEVQGKKSNDDFRAMLLGGK